MSYSIAGALGSAAVGLLLGSLGERTVPSSLGPAIMVIVICAALLASARELKLFHLPLAQLRRQTYGWWGNRAPAVVAPAIWGIDVGLTFATWLMFSGPIVLAIVGIAGGSALLGGALFLAHWLGRAASVWLAPSWLSRGQTTSALLADIEKRGVAARRMHAGAILLAAIFFVMSAR